ncbi:MAG: alpha/beta hydrolase family protein [Actinomycetota bacterium]
MRLSTFLRRLEAQARAAARPVTTHRYGPSPEHVADLRLPDGPGPHPVVVVLHGGFWLQEWDRHLMDALCIDLARRGWATWNAEYRRLGAGGGVPATLDDVDAAARAVASCDAPLDRDRVVSLGHSAGGYLALWLAGTGTVAGALSMAGVCDVVGAAREGLAGGVAGAFLGGGPGKSPEAYARADLARRLPTGVPQVVVHGDGDTAVPPEHSRWYAQRCREAGERCTLVELEATGHFELLDPGSAAWAAACTHLEALTGRA